MGKVGIGVGGRTQFIEGIAFTGDGLTPISTDMWQEATVAEFVLGARGRGAFRTGLSLANRLVFGGRRCDAEKVLDLLADLRVGAVDRLVGRQGHAREGAPVSRHDGLREGFAGVKRREGGYATPKMQRHRRSRQKSAAGFGGDSKGSVVFGLSNGPERANERGQRVRVMLRRGGGCSRGRELSHSDSD